MTDTRQVLEEAYQRIFPFGTHRQRGLTGAQSDRQRNRFTRFLDAEAWTDAALCLVPEGCAYRVTVHSDECLAHILPDNPFYKGPALQFGTGPIPALAIAQAALRAKEAGDE